MQAHQRSAKVWVARGVFSATRAGARNCGSYLCAQWSCYAKQGSPSATGKHSFKASRVPRVPVWTRSDVLSTCFGQDADGLLRLTQQKRQL